MGSEYCKKKFPFYPEPPKVLPITFGQETVDEGEFAQLICIVVKGDEPLSITWSMQGARVNSGPTISTTMLGTRTSMLTIDSVGHRHSGEYTCVASNRAGSEKQSTELKVNGRLCLQGEEEENVVKD